MKQELLNHRNPYRAVEGKLFAGADIAKWDSQKFEEFFDFSNKLYDMEKLKISCTRERVLSLEAEMEEEGCTHNEFMHRISKWIDENADDVANKGFYMRFGTMLRVVVQYLKKHPSALTESMRDKLADKPQYAWCLEHFAPRTTVIGAEIIEAVHDSYTGNMQTKDAKVPNTDKLIMDGILKVGELYLTIANSITKKDLEKMNVKDKIGSLQKLGSIHATLKNFKPNSQIFQQININASGREELETALLDFAREEQ